MCGICGIVDFGNTNIEKKDIVGMTDILAHRGPDDKGFYLDAHVALGIRRLSIIDLDTGNQPMYNEDKSIWLVYNGEIYNYHELSESLKNEGHIFYTRSDTEVIIHLYEKYREKCVDYLNGIFAFALWDKKSRMLLLARDRLGVKPLFYYQDKQKFLFGSEIKSILQYPSVKREVNQEALYHFLSLNYTPSPLTMFKNIHSLPAGHMIICSEGNTGISKYWDVTFKEMPGSDGIKICEQLREHLTRSVSMQLASDVPVGLFLSGGIDSSVILYFMRKNFSRPIKTFNVRFEEPSYDESSYATLASQFFGSKPYEIFCKPKDYIKYLPDIVWHSDSLTVDISMLPLYLVSKLASEYVRVVLTGDGADELFAGYPTYVADRLVNFYQRLPYPIKNGFIPFFVERLPVSEKKLSFEFKAKRFIQGARLSPEEAHFFWRIIFSEEDKKSLFAGGILENRFENTFCVYRRFYQNTKSDETPIFPRDTMNNENLGRYQYADMKVWLADSILAKVDFMSMANSLEIRVPYLDHQLVEFMANIPARFKLNNFTGKYILKKAMKNRIPSPILKRSKAGFNIPMGGWLRRELKGIMTDILCKDAVNRIGYFNWVYIEKLIEEHLNLKKDHGYKLLSLMHFCLWHDKFIRTSKAGGNP